MTEEEPSTGVRPRPLLSVRDVERASLWYQRLLGAESGHGGEEYERVVVNGIVVLQLHSIEAGHHHGSLASSDAPLGNGVLVWFEVDELDAILERVQRHDLAVHTPVHRNPNSGTREVWLYDEDRYVVVCSEP